MNLIKKIMCVLIVLGGLAQQTFGWFDNFKKVMSDNYRRGGRSSSWIRNLCK